MALSSRSISASHSALTARCETPPSRRSFSERLFSSSASLRLTVADRLMPSFLPLRLSAVVPRSLMIACKISFAMLRALARLPRWPHRDLHEPPCHLPDPQAAPGAHERREIGRASCRERVWIGECDDSVNI